jgi:hypothetical protein
VTINASSCFVKTNRAREILGQLNAAHEEVGGPSYLRTEFVEQDGWHVARLRILAPVPPRVSCIVGDIIHNLRSALDHLACLIVENSGAAVTRTTQFPITESASRFAEVVQKQLGGVGAPFLKFVENLQPFSSQAPSPNRLEVIHRLDIKDKHRNLLIASVLPHHIQFEAEGREGAIVESKLCESLPFPLTDGLELLRLRLREDVRLEQLRIVVQLGASLAFMEDGPELGQPLVPLLYELTKYVEEHVLYAAEVLSGSAA